MGHVGKVAFDV